jgi:hypothetical protein
MAAGANSGKRAGLVQGMVVMLVLRTLLFGAAEGHQIAEHISCTTDDVLQVKHGSGAASHGAQGVGCREVVGT